MVGNSTQSSRDTASFCLLVFDENNRCAVSRSNSGFGPTACGEIGVGESPLNEAAKVARELVGQEVRVTRITAVETARGSTELFFSLIEGSEPPLVGLEWLSIENVRRVLDEGSDFKSTIDAITPFIIRIPYLNLDENDFIYRFRTEAQRNRDIYASDEKSRSIYQSALCQAIKAAKRQRERSADSPACLDFGPVRYVLPSHFGFCLGVQNAIERAYETLAENPGRRVFMISELIHNPFVNEDLRDRGLVNLQSDRGVPVINPATGVPWWDELGKGDIVLTPAFGATDEDKVRLIEKGLAINRYDATCMLVEKVWKAARRFAREGFTIIIHGKNEHEETKATYSNCAKHGPSIIIRDRSEAEILGRVILAPTRAEKGALFAPLADRHTPGFDVERDLERVAVVNQTTLLRNETVGIIDYLESVMEEKYGPEEASQRLHMKSRGDTLCYATQVNQDALRRAMEAEADFAIVVGGRNSSNTYQLFRVCEQRFGERTYYIQSERNILSAGTIEHYEFPEKPAALGAGTTVERPFLRNAGRPVRILITGGASCPDGIIQQVITRINGFFPGEQLRSIESVLEALAEDHG